MTKIPGLLQQTNLNPLPIAGIDPLQNKLCSLSLSINHPFHLLDFHFFPFIFTWTILSPYKVLPLHPAALQLPFWLDKDQDDDNDDDDNDDDDNENDDDVKSRQEIGGA